MPRGDYHKLMIGSAQELNRLRNLGAGFSWKDAGRPLPSRLPEGMTTFLESSVVPINLSSSSSSDTDDDVPLSSRVKRPKVHLGDDVSAQKAPSNARADPQPAAPKLVDEQPATVVEPVQTVEEPVQETAASPGNATAPASCSKQDASKSVGTKRAKKSRQKADVNTEAAGTAQAFPPVSDTPANPEEDKKPGKSVKRTRAAAAKPQKKETVMEANKEKDIKSGPAPKAAPKKTVKVRKQAGAAKPQQKEPVINLEAKKEEDFEFTTAPKATPKKTVNLKTLQRENPKLYEAALNRYKHYEVIYHYAYSKFSEKLQGSGKHYTGLYPQTTQSRTIRISAEYCTQLEVFLKLRSLHTGKHISSYMLCCSDQCNECLK